MTVLLRVFTNANTSVCCGRKSRTEVTESTEKENEIYRPWKEASKAIRSDRVIRVDRVINDFNDPIDPNGVMVTGSIGNCLFYALSGLLRD